MKRIFITVLFCITSYTSQAEELKIAEYIKVNPPSEMDLTFQVVPDYSPDEEILLIWNGDELDYLVVTDRERGGQKHELYWRMILKEFQKSSGRKKVKISNEGELTTKSGLKVSYKTVEWFSEGDKSVQMLSLVVGRKDAYWLIVNSTNEDMARITESFKRILETIELTRG
ncbi:hypothetical protein BTJ40_12285 [Microbulbifer sp. A4B17]|uniref:hypothetical protein n=1 Tax=Microbulbifer sp. A4B17 TaxID=359370 RepID=UPI000D52F1A9|nr:hypothetical protein [Microbulbifer sp. A4B17]AWF81539.1 hypothetical protein BTJ40_12285 [Microbulbifer sp. A4B17]